MIWFSHLFARWNETHFTFTGQWWGVWKWLGILLVEMGAIGFVVGSTIFGLNLLYTCAFFGMNYNDAFSAFRMNRYNNFLRLRITGDRVEIFAIALESVPERHEWVPNPPASRGNPEEPVFIPETELQPHIEKIVL